MMSNINRTYRSNVDLSDITKALSQSMTNFSSCQPVQAYTMHSQKRYESQPTLTYSDYLERGDKKWKRKHSLQTHEQKQKAYDKYKKQVEFKRKCRRIRKTCYAVTLGFLEFLLRFIIIIFWFWVTKSILMLITSSSDSSNKVHAVITRQNRLPGSYEYLTTDVTAEELTAELFLEGPFISEAIQNKEYDEAKMSSAAAFVFICVIERWSYPKGGNTKDLSQEDFGHPTSIAKVVMKNDTQVGDIEPLDYNNYPRKARVSIPPSESPDSSKEYRYVLGFGVDVQQQKAVPFNVRFNVDPVPMRTRILIGTNPAMEFAILSVLLINPGIAAYFACATAAAAFVKLGQIVDTVNITAKWMDLDLLVYVLFGMIFVSILSETRIFSCLAFNFIKITRERSFWLSIILINVLSFVLSIFFNNIMVSLLLTPLVIRLMELLHLDPRPILINMIMMCNIGGRAGVGTLASKIVLQHKEAINNELTMKKMVKMMLPSSILTGAATYLYFHIIYHFLSPQVPDKRNETFENEQLTLLWNRASVSIPNVSGNWHIIRGKMKDVTSRLKKELLAVKFRNVRSELTWNERMTELDPENRIHNWFLLVKCGLTFGIFVALMITYLYNIKLKPFHDHEEIRLGFIGLYCLLLVLLLVHARSFGQLLKRVDWQSLMILLAIGMIPSVFTIVADKMDDFVWKMFGPTMKGTKREKIVKFVTTMLAFSSISALFNEYTVVAGMLDTILIFAKGAGFGAMKEILCGFLLFTGSGWGNATILAAIPNVVVRGVAEIQGYRIRFYQFMTYGIPISLINVFIIYLELTF